MTSLSADPDISEQEWERSIDDPFSADAMGVLNHIAPSTADKHTQQRSPQSQPAGKAESREEKREEEQAVEELEAATAAFGDLDDAALISVTPIPASFTSTRHFNLLTPRSNAAANPVARRPSAVTPTSQHRHSIYGDEDDSGKHSQDDDSTNNTSTSVSTNTATQPSTRYTRSATRPLLATTLPFGRVNIAKAETWLHQQDSKPLQHQEERKQKEERDEDDGKRVESALEFGASDADSAGAAGVEMFGGFTTGSSKPVAVSAASLERARRLMAEADDEYSQQHAHAADDGPLLQSAQSSKRPQPQPSSFGSPAASLASSTSLLSARKSTAFVPPSSFKTPARLSRPAAVPSADKPPSFTSHRRQPSPPPPPPAHQQCGQSTDGGVPAEFDMMAGFATGSGRRVTVSESSLQRAQQLMREAEEEDASKQRGAANDSSGATELQFKSVRSHQQQQQHSSAALSSFSTASSSSPQAFRPPPSTFRPPARTAARQSAAPPPSSATASPQRMQPRAQGADKPYEQPQRHQEQQKRDAEQQAPSSKAASKAELFEQWMKEQGMQVDDDDSAGLELLPPHIGAHDGTAMMDGTFTTAAGVAGLATFEDEPDSAVLSSLPSTESSAFTSSPASAFASASASTASTFSSPRLPPQSPHAPSFEGFGGFVTGANRPIAVRPETLLRAQQLIADAQQPQQQDEEQQQQQQHERRQFQQTRDEPSSEDAIEFGFVTGRGAKAVVRPESLKRAQMLFADDDEQHDKQQQQAEAGQPMMGGFTTGGGKKAVVVRPESLARAQQLLADVDAVEQQPQQQDEADEPVMALGFTTGGGKKAAVLRPESVLRAQRLLADVDAMEQEQQEEDRNDKEKACWMDAEKPLLHPFYSGRPPLATLSANALHARNSNYGIDETKAGASAGRDDEKPLLARRQVGKRVNERSAVDLQRSPLADSPLPSPVTTLQAGPAERAANNSRDAKAGSKKRKLTFNTPRPLAPGQRSSGKKGKPSDDEQQPNTLSAPGKPAKGAVPLPPPDLPPAPLPVSPAAVLQFSLKAQRMERLSRNELIDKGVAPAIVDMTSQAALSHTFPFSSNSDIASAASCYSATTAYFHLLQSGCDRSLLSVLWVLNHYRWIVWKLACIERSYPTQLSGRCCTYYQVMLQLRKRFNRELELVKRPALAKLLEQDESAAKYMVLCVAAILPSGAPPAAIAVMSDGNVREATETGTGRADSNGGVSGAGGDAVEDDDPDTALLLHRKQYGVCHVELTDGWYSVAAKLDAPLLALLKRDRIRVGDKLRVFNASLSGGSDACAPLENENVYLELHANSTRRARHDCKLGVQRTALFSVCLASVREGGGAIPCMHAAVGRVYPMMSMEVMEDGTKVHRNQRAEDAQQELWERRVEKEMELKRAEWEKKAEQSAALSQPQQPFMPTPNTQSQYSQLRYSDPTSSVLAAEALELEAPEPRRLAPYLKVRLHEVVPPLASVAFADSECPAADSGLASLPAVLTGAECMFTVWRPNEEDLYALAEGNVVSVYSAHVAGRHDGLLRLSSSRGTPTITNVSIPPLTALFRRPCSFPQLHALQRGDEFDIAVCIVHENRYSSRATFTNELQHTRQLYCCYDSDDLLMVDVTEDGKELHFAAGQPLHTPLTLLACNLRYQGYDKTHRIHTAQSSASATFSTKAAAGWEKQEGEKAGSARQHLMEGWRQCRRWFASDGGKEVAVMHRQRAVSLVEGMEDEKWGSSAQAMRVGSQLWFDALLRTIAAVQANVASAAEVAGST